MDDINSKADSNFPELRQQMEDHDPDICEKQVLHESGFGTHAIPMTDEECRAKITADVEQQVLVAGVIASVVCIVIAVVIVLTWRRINALRANRPNDDDIVFENPVESTLEAIANTAAATSFDNESGSRPKSKGFKF
jgi:hypothetical protein